MTKRRRTIMLVIVAALIGAAVLAWFGVAPQLKRPDVTPPALVPQEWAEVHDSPGHALHVGQKQLACSTCHDESDGGFRSLRETACTGCHANEVAHHHEGGAANPTSCLTCHQFKEAPAPTCLGCHSQRQGQSPAVEVHVSSGAPCLSCHQPHGDKKVVQTDCSNCHKDIKANHGDLQVSTDIANHEMPLAATEGRKGIHPANGTCADCHAPHSHAVEARGKCQGCHEGAPQGPRPSDHAACVTCHAPHDLTVAAVKPCAGCHAEKRAAITMNHTACKTCHTPHETQNARTACTTCHAAQRTLGAPAVAAHAACDNCHKPHDPQASLGNACTSCHSSITPKHAPGGPNTCTTCHAMHPDGGAVLATAIAKPCTGCHKQKAKSDVAGHTKGLGCVSCHKPHEFDLGKPKTALCASCHGAETKVTFASKGHKDCIQCHSDVHEPQHEKTCATCHGAEASSAPPGHQACQQCHQPHDGHVKPTATCQSCHAEEASTKHAHVAGGCATCHKPHGPSGPSGPPGTVKAPACTTCHAPPKLPGLHQLLGKTPNGHQQCASCHSSHQAPRDDRATCTKCHEDRKNHQPQATECKGCHIFRGP